MNTIKKLGDKISSELDNGKPLKDLKLLVKVYSGTDWEKHIKNVPTGEYQRVKVFTDKNIDIFIITWASQSKTPIHSHPKNGCIMRILKHHQDMSEHKELIETIYYGGKENDLIENNPTIKKNSRTITETYCNFIDNTIGIHQITNPDILPNNYVYSIHVYSPPNYYS